jgi:tetratricopeptide (TPR) repeat protein
MKNKPFLCLIILFLFSTLVQASPVDSLENVLKTAKGEQKVKTLNELFRAYINSNPVKAIGFTSEALNLATSIKDKKGMAASYNNLGVAYRSQGALDRSLENYLTALRLYEEIKNQEGIATIKNNIGTIYSIKKDQAQAMKYYEEALQQFTSLNDQPKMIGSLNNLGNLHSDLQLYEQALKFYSQANQLSEKIGKLNLDPLANIGNVYYRQGNYQKAIEFYEKAKKIAEKENDQLSLLSIVSNMGEVYAKVGQGAKAQTLLDTAMSLCRSLQAYIYEPQILKSQASNFAKQGKMKEAYETMLKYDEAKEKIYGEESTRKTAQMEMALDFKEKEKELEQLKMEDTVKTLELKNTRMVIIVSVLAIFVAIALFNMFYSKRRAK